MNAQAVQRGAGPQQCVQQGAQAVQVLHFVKEERMRGFICPCSALLLIQTAAVKSGLTRLVGRYLHLGARQLRMVRAGKGAWVSSATERRFQHCSPAIFLTEVGQRKHLSALGAAAAPRLQ